MLVVAVQALLTGCAVFMAFWAGMPWPGTAAIAVLGGAAIACTLTPNRLCLWAVPVSWVCTLAIPASVLLAGEEGFSFESYLDDYYAVLAWLVAAVILPLSYTSREGGPASRWRLPAMLWAFFGGAVWLVTAYLQNRAGSFYAGLMINIALLVLCHIWFRPPMLGAQAINTLILVCVGLPVADLFFDSKHKLSSDATAREQHYSYSAAKKDPTAFARWWNYYLAQWKLTERQIVTPGAVGPLPYRLRPMTTGMLGQCEISINSLGFRGREIPRDKGETYRIVALGESTTFGITLNPGHRPWPEQLEEMIRTRLKLSRPVEVINAGVPGYTLADNLYRYAGDIQPLQPDLLITYHGINGFPMLYSALPPNVRNDPPPYRERPLAMLADCEYRLKMMSYRRAQTVSLAATPPAMTNLLTTVYGEAYRELVRLAETNRIRLVVANFSMAIDEASEREALEFYQVGYPTAPWLLKVNAAHTELVELLGRSYPGVSIADTHARLNGVHENFLDLVHLSPQGDTQLAENMFTAIRTLLEQDLKPVENVAGQSVDARRVASAAE